MFLLFIHWLLLLLLLLWIEKERAFLHSGRKTIHSLNNFRGVFLRSFVHLFVCFLLQFLPCLLINSITYVEHRRKIAHTQTLKHVALYSSFFIVQHHHRAISFSLARNYEWSVCACAWYTARSPTFDVYYDYDQIHYVIVSMHYPFVRLLGRSVELYVHLTHWLNLVDCLFVHLVHILFHMSYISSLSLSDSMQNYSTKTKWNAKINWHFLL